MHNRVNDIFLPNFCSLRMFFAVFFLAEMLAILLTLATDFSRYGFYSELGIRSLLTLWVVLSAAVILCVTRNFLARFNHLTVGLIAFFMVQMIAALVGWLVAEGLPKWDLMPVLIKEQERWPFYLRMLGISSIVSVVFFRYL